jgi:hypothetical protein
MYKAFYEQLTFTWLPLAATLFFVAVFAIVLLRLFVLRRRKDFDSIAALPLFDDEVHHER